jgi:hypothetical protein
MAHLTVDPRNPTTPRDSYLDDDTNSSMPIPKASASPQFASPSRSTSGSDPHTNSKNGSWPSNPQRPTSPTTPQHWTQLDKGRHPVAFPDQRDPFPTPTKQGHLAGLTRFRASPREAGPAQYLGENPVRPSAPECDRSSYGPAPCAATSDRRVEGCQRRIADSEARWSAGWTPIRGFRRPVAGRGPGGARACSRR